MNASGGGRLFAGPIPQVYERCLVPLIFQVYADEVARRVARLQPGQVLETAAGTGVLTRAMARALPGAALVATDLNPPMLEMAQAVGTATPVAWRQADAQSLPFDDARFDVVVCQFGAMFFPDKVHAFGEARRVLRPGGHFIFSVWDGLQDNDIPRLIVDALADVLPAPPPQFLQRLPHGYFDVLAIGADVQAAGFEAPAIETIAARSRAASAWEAAFAYCQGTPLRLEIEANAGLTLDDATSRCAQALERHFGAGPVDGKIQAHVVCARR